MGEIRNAAFGFGAMVLLGGGILIGAIDSKRRSESACQQFKDVAAKSLAAGDVSAANSAIESARKECSGPDELTVAELKWRASSLAKVSSTSAPVTTTKPPQVEDKPLTLAQVVALAMPYMSDTVDDMSPGSIPLLAWAIPNMRLADVSVARNETSLSLIQKDSDEARGKRMCVGGSLIEIHAQKTDVGKFFIGLLMNDEAQLVSFMAVGSAGDLVAHSSARFCGVVIGRHDYANSGGGTSHAASIVGMFDLPENRPAKPQVVAKPIQRATDAATVSKVAAVATSHGGCGCGPGDLTCAMRCSTK